MLTDPRLWVGIAVGGLAAWWWRSRQQSNLVPAGPGVGPKPLRRRGRLR